MENIALNTLKTRIQSFAIFRGLLSDEVISSLVAFLEKPTVSGYSEFTAHLFNANASSLGEYIKDICENNENIYVKTVGMKKPVPEECRVKHFKERSFQNGQGKR